MFAIAIMSGSPYLVKFLSVHQLESEQERIDLEWRAERKAMRQAYLEDVERYEVEKSKETVCIRPYFLF